MTPKIISNNEPPSVRHTLRFLFPRLLRKKNFNPDWKIREGKLVRAFFLQVFSVIAAPKEVIAVFQLNFTEEIWSEAPTSRIVPMFVSRKLIYRDANQKPLKIFTNHALPRTTFKFSARALCVLCLCRGCVWGNLKENAL